MAKKDQRLVEIEEDFERLEKVIRLEVTKTKKISVILNALKLYPSNSYDACMQLYRCYRLKANRYPDTNIIKKLKEKIKEYSPKVTKASQPSSLFQI